MKGILILIGFFAWAPLSHAGGSIVSGGFNDLSVQVKFQDNGDGIDSVAKEKLLEFALRGLGNGTLIGVHSDFSGAPTEITYCVEFSSPTVRDHAIGYIDEIVRNGKNISGVMMATCRLY